MAELKLARLPDRTLVKIAITVTPDLDAALRDYLGLYRSTYGDNATTVADLIPAMLENFLNSDRTFSRVRKDVAGRAKS